MICQGMKLHCYITYLSAISFANFSMPFYIYKIKSKQFINTSEYIEAVLFNIYWQIDELYRPLRVSPLFPSFLSNLLNTLTI